jgi:hypothetical protein
MSYIPSAFLFFPFPLSAWEYETAATRVIGYIVVINLLPLALTQRGTREMPATPRCVVVGKAVFLIWCLFTCA